MKKKVILSIIIAIIAVCLCVFITGFIQEKPQVAENFSGFIPVQESWTFPGGHLSLFSSLIGNITVNSSIIPESPREIRIYRGYFREGDLVENITGPLMREVHNPIPKDQALENAIRILEPYGGLPPDAILQYNLIQYGEIRNRTTGEIIRKINEGNFVSWYKNLDGMEIEGGSDIIQIEMGENGTLVHLSKRWRTYEPLGNVTIIPVNKAIDKLAAEEVLNPISAQVSDVEIYNIHLSYYIQGIDEPEVTLEPIWVFYGNASGTGVPFFVYARQFANFTATPTYGSAPLTVTFTDTSDASPVKWNWDFGDGTTSTEQNPVHTYTTAGTYTVTLKATNYLGSDTTTKTSFVLIGKKAIVIRTGTKLDELLAALEVMDIQNGIRNSLIQKVQNAKAKNDDALKFIDQNKETQANNQLNAEDNQMNALINQVDAQTGKGITSDNAATLKAMAAEIRDLIQKAIATPI